MLLISLAVLYKHLAPITKKACDTVVVKATSKLSLDMEIISGKSLNMCVVQFIGTYTALCLPKSKLIMRCFNCVCAIYRHIYIVWKGEIHKLHVLHNYYNVCKNYTLCTHNVPHNYFINIITIIFIQMLIKP